MPLRVAILSLLVVALAHPSLADMPRDRTVRGAIAADEDAPPLPVPGFLKPFQRQAPTGTGRFRAEDGLGALHARNRFGTTWTCVGDCDGVTPTPVSPEDRATLMRRGIAATPPGNPVFLRPPTRD